VQTEFYRANMQCKILEASDSEDPGCRSPFHLSVPTAELTATEDLVNKPTTNRVKIKIYRMHTL